MCPKCLGEWVAWQEDEEQAQAHYAALERGGMWRRGEYALVAAEARETLRSKAHRASRKAAHAAGAETERRRPYHIDYCTVTFEPATAGELTEQPENLFWPS